MVKVRARPETGNLYLDFGYRGKRCREQTSLADTCANRRKVEAMARRMQRDMAQGRFDYAGYFPDSPRAKLFAQGPVDTPAPQASTSGDPDLPTFGAFAETWFNESKPRWRSRYLDGVRDMLDKHFLPTFAAMPLDQISRGDILGFRAEFAKRPGRRGGTVSARRINKVVGVLRSIITEGCDRHGLVSPARGIKPLKQARSEIHPFTLEEIERMINTVRSDYRAYLVTRFYTGLRTGEVNGLQWRDVDFDASTIEVRRTVSRGGDGGLKTSYSKRTIPMVPVVRSALLDERNAASQDIPWVFHTRGGNPIDATNFTNRVWYPLLRYLGLEKRNPYQTRHTAATLMLASGENPEWVARVLGQSTTEMLFRVYSRYVPNITRQDGRAYTGMLATHSPAPQPAKRAIDAAADIDAMSPEQLRQALHAVLDTHSHEK